MESSSKVNSLIQNLDFKKSSKWLPAIYFDFLFRSYSACTSFFTLNFIKSAIYGETGELSNGGLINFGEFEDASYNLWQLLVFAGMIYNIKTSICICKSTLHVIANNRIYNFHFTHIYSYGIHWSMLWGTFQCN